MTTFWIFIALVMLVGLMLIWIPHFRQQKLLKTEEAGVRKQTNLELFNERLGVLEKELSEELLDQAEFDALKKSLKSVYSKTSKKRAMIHWSTKSSQRRFYGRRSCQFV